MPLREFVTDTRPLDQLMRAASPRDRRHSRSRPGSASELTVDEGAPPPRRRGGRSARAAALRRRDSRRRRRRRSHLRRQPQRQLDQRLLRRLPVLRLRPPSQGRRRLQPLDRRRAGEGAGRGRPRRHRGLHAGRHQPGDRRVRLSRPARAPSRAVSRDLHIHAFSPMEIMYGARRTGMSYRDYLTMLRDAGLGTIPGTAAEILDDEVREMLSHKKVDVRTWVEIITTAHELGLRTSSTVMYGHIETPEHDRPARRFCCATCRSGPAASPSSCRCASSTPTPSSTRSGMAEPPPTGPLDLRVYAVSRLMLRGWIDNLQTSWVKLGTELAQLTLAGRLQRLRRHADGGVDLQGRRRRRGRVPPRRSDPRADSRSRPHSRPTDDDVWQRSRTTCTHGSRCWLAEWERRGFCADSARFLIRRDLTVVVNTADDDELLRPARLARPRHGHLHARRRGRPRARLGPAPATSSHCLARPAALLRPRPGSASATATSPRTSIARDAPAPRPHPQPDDRRDLAARLGVRAAASCR